MQDGDLIDGRAADVWSLGVTLFAMLVGQFPWKIATPVHKPYAQYLSRFELARKGGPKFWGAAFSADPSRFGFDVHVCRVGSLPSLSCSSLTLVHGDNL